MHHQHFQLHAAIEEQHWWFLARRHILRELVHQVAPPSLNATIVDVGCGTGANIAAFAEEYTCYGIDTSPAGIELARGRFPKVNFLCGHAPDIFQPEQTAARVFLLNDVLEHVADDFHFFSRLWQALPVGAHVLLTVPADESLWTQHDVSFGHFRRYDAPRLTRVWEGMPITVRLQSYYMTRLYPLAKFVCRWSQWRGQAQGVAGTHFSIPPPPVNRLLQRIMAGESNRLVNVMHGGGTPYRRGVSIIALLRREPGEVEIRTRPANVAPDQHVVATEHMTPVSSPG